MKKKLLRLVTAAMAAVLMVSVFAGCQKKEKLYTGDFGLNIITINKGYGTDWLYALKEEFEGMYPGITVNIKTEVTDDNITNKLDAGEEYCQYDLFFTGTDLAKYIKTSVSGEEPVLAELSDIYNNPAAAGEANVIDRLDESLAATFKIKNGEKTEYYTMPWTQGINGLLYNGKVMREKLGENWKETYPCRTTEEWMDLIEALAAAGQYAFIYAADTQYYQMLYNAWWTQYEGLEGINNYYSGLAYDAAYDKMTVNRGIFQQQGRLEAMKVMESIMKDPYVYPDSKGIDWNSAQTYFMSGRSAMFPNGDWNNIEMGKMFPENEVQFMKVPVVSALGTKLGITEDELCLAVDYADKVLAGEEAQKPAIVPQEVAGKTLTVDEVLEAVVEARSVVDTYSNYYTAAIAAWSPRMQYAKEFLRLMVSDKGQEIYSKSVNGNTTLPYGFDISKTDWYAGVSDFAKSRFEIARGATYYYAHTELPLGRDLMAFRAVFQAPIEHLFYGKGWTAEQVIDVDVTYYNTGTNWNSLLELAQLG